MKNGFENLKNVPEENLSKDLEASREIAKRDMKDREYEESAICVKERASVQTVPIQDKVALTIREAAEYSNIGINKLESILRSPRCPFVLYVGKKKLVKRKEFEKFIADNVEI